MSSYSTNIIPKDCNYNCGTRIYWNNQENAYFEVFSKSRHQCPNRLNNKKSITETSSVNSSKPNYYYNNKFSKQPKPKMSNSLELLTDPIDTIQKKYEILSDIVSEFGGKCHGSQSHIMPNNTISLVVYYEVPEGKREEVKQKFNIITKNQIVLQSN